MLSDSYHGLVESTGKTSEVPFNFVIVLLFFTIPYRVLLRNSFLARINIVLSFPWIFFTGSSHHFNYS